MSLAKWLTKKLSNYLLKNILPSHDYLCDFSRICHEVRPADILLIEGRNRISGIVQRTILSPWSHAALYIGPLHNVEDPAIRELIQKHYKGQPSEQLLIESVVGFGTIIVPISKYKPEHIRICRPTGLAYQDVQKIIAHAAKTLGTKYNIRHFFDLGRFLMVSRLLPRRWNSSLFKATADQMRQDICSTMIAKAFNSVKFPILPLVRENDNKRLELIRRNPRLYAPSDFDYSPYFDIIKYPILPVSGFSVYHHLPWKDTLMSNDDQGLVEQNEDTKP